MNENSQNSNSVEEKVFQEAVAEAKRLEGMRWMPSKESGIAADKMGEIFSKKDSAISSINYERALEYALFCENKAPKPTKIEKKEETPEETRERMLQEELEAMKKKFAELDAEKENESHLETPAKAKETKKISVPKPTEPAPKPMAKPVSLTPKKITPAIPKETKEAQIAKAKIVGQQPQRALPKKVPAPQAIKANRTFFDKVEKNIVGSAIGPAPSVSLKKTIAPTQQRIEAAQSKKLDELRARLAEKIKNRRRKSIEEEKAEQLKEEMDEEFEN